MDRFTAKNTAALTALIFIFSQSVGFATVQQQDYTGQQAYAPTTSANAPSQTSTTSTPSGSLVPASPLSPATAQDPSVGTLLNRSVQAETGRISIAGSSNVSRRRNSLSVSGISVENVPGANDNAQTAELIYNVYQNGTLKVTRSLTLNAGNTNAISFSSDNTLQSGVNASFELILQQRDAAGNIIFKESYTSPTYSLPSTSSGNPKSTLVTNTLGLNLNGSLNVTDGNFSLSGIKITGTQNATTSVTFDLYKITASGNVKVATQNKTTTSDNTALTFTAQGLENETSYYWTLTVTQTTSTAKLEYKGNAFDVYRPLNTPEFPALLELISGANFTRTFSASGGKPPYAWSLALTSQERSSLETKATSIINFTNNYSFLTNKRITEYDASLTPAQKAALDTNGNGTVFDEMTPYDMNGDGYISGADAMIYINWINNVPSYFSDKYGLTLNSNGTLSGTPKGEGNFTFTLTLRDSDQNVLNKALNVKIAPAITIQNAAMPEPRFGESYNYTLTAQGGTQPYTWTFDGTAQLQDLKTRINQFINTTGGQSKYNPDGSLNLLYAANESLDFDKDSFIGPMDVLKISNRIISGDTDLVKNFGLTLNASTGQITGTPNATASLFGDIVLRDAAGNTKRVSFSLNIQPGTPVITGQPADGKVGVNYSFQLGIQQFTGSGPFTWTIIDGLSALNAAGLSFSNGAFSGTPTRNGTISVKVKVTDQRGEFSTKDLTLSVTNPAPVIVGIPAAAEVGKNYNFSFSIQNSTGEGASVFSLTSGLSSLQAAGLTFSSDGKISGVPTQSGSFSLTIKATDSINQFSTKTVTFTIDKPAPVIQGNPPTATFNSFFDFTFTVPQETREGNLIWEMLPNTSALTNAGLSFSNGRISGTPSRVTELTLSVKVTDARGKFSTKDFSLSIIGAAPIIATTSIANKRAGEQINTQFSLQQNTGTAPLFWEISAGSLGSGLSLNPSTGAVTGTAADPGQQNFTLRVTDSLGRTTTKDFSFTIYKPVPQIDAPSTLPVARINQPFNYTFTPLSGTGEGPLTWSITAGAMGGLTLNSSSGSLSGTPTAGATLTFTVKVRDSLGGFTTKDFTLEILKPAPLIISPEILPQASLGKNYNFSLSVKPGTGNLPLTWSLETPLPSGLTLNTSTGALSGKPNSLGTFSFTAKVIDSRGEFAIKQFSLAVIDSGLLDAQNYVTSLIAAAKAIVPNANYTSTVVSPSPGTYNAAVSCSNCGTMGLKSMSFSVANSGTIDAESLVAVYNRTPSDITLTNAEAKVLLSTWDPNLPDDQTPPLAKMMAAVFTGATPFTSTKGIKIQYKLGADYRVAYKTSGEFSSIIDDIDYYTYAGDAVRDIRSYLGTDFQVSLAPSSTTEMNPTFKVVLTRLSAALPGGYVSKIVIPMDKKLLADFNNYEIQISKSALGQHLFTFLFPPANGTQANSALTQKLFMGINQISSESNLNKADEALKLLNGLRFYNDTIVENVSTTPPNLQFRFMVKGINSYYVIRSSASEPVFDLDKYRLGFRMNLQEMLGNTVSVSVENEFIHTGFKISITPINAQSGRAPVTFRIFSLMGTNSVEISKEAKFIYPNGTIGWNYAFTVQGLAGTPSFMIYDAYKQLFRNPLEMAAAVSWINPSEVLVYPSAPPPQQAYTLYPESLRSVYDGKLWRKITRLSNGAVSSELDLSGSVRIFVDQLNARYAQLNPLPTSPRYGLDYWEITAIPQTDATFNIAISYVTTLTPNINRYPVAAYTLNGKAEIVPGSIKLWKEIPGRSQMNPSDTQITLEISGLDADKIYESLKLINYSTLFKNGDYRDTNNAIDALVDFQPVAIIRDIYTKQMTKIIYGFGSTPQTVSGTGLKSDKAFDYYEANISASGAVTTQRSWAQIEKDYKDFYSQTFPDYNVGFSKNPSGTAVTVTLTAKSASVPKGQLKSVSFNHTLQGTKLTFDVNSLQLIYRDPVTGADLLMNRDVSKIFYLGTKSGVLRAKYWVDSLAILTGLTLRPNSVLTGSFYTIRFSYLGKNIKIVNVSPDMASSSWDN